MKRTVHALFVVLVFGGAVGASTLVNAAPITFNTALPVAKGAFINREQLIVRRFDDDTSIADRKLDANGLVSVLGYGVTPKFALFAALPYFDKTLDVTANGERVTRSSQGFGDLKMFGRYTIFQQDERSKTFRIAGFGGLKAPTGEGNQRDSLGPLPVPLQSGTGAWDSFAGVVLTVQTLGFQVDAQLSVEKKGSANDFEMGDEARADLSFQYRLLPQEMSSDTHSFLYGVLEANLINQDNNRISGMDDSNSGGTTLYLTPGIQYVTIKYILEAAVQLPVLQNLHGNALETDYVFTTGFRVNF
ncbi:transporter [Dasania marina]|uniref:transporter n=1 Tax=Dasania marina TaxID=471499 RepID=UPI0030DC2C33|tara:strand:- start:6688 stop:7596 length:909 start_codon:yes stop_codon:yes gene_type:complete